MAYSALSDLVLPESMAADVLNIATTNSRVFASGAVADVTNQLEVIPSKGKVIMPFWNDLDGASQPTHHGVDLTVNAVTQGQDEAAVLARGKAFGAEDLAAAFKGADPVQFIEQRFGDYWAREFDRVAVQNILAALATTVSGASMAANVLDISGLTGNADVLTDSAMIDAAGLLGDQDDALAAVLMHSNVRRFLQKLDVVEDFVPSEGSKTIRRYRGRDIIETDRLTATSGAYPIIFVGTGAVAYARGTPKKAAEVHREPLLNGGEEAAITRHIFTLHPRGIAFAATPAGNTATDAELATAANWERVWTAKNVRMTILKADLA